VQMNVKSRQRHGWFVIWEWSKLPIRGFESVRCSVESGSLDCSRGSGLFLLWRGGHMGPAPYLSHGPAVTYRVESASLFHLGHSLLDTLFPG